MKPLGSRWRELRIDLDLSVEQVAPSLRIAPGSLRNIEANQPRAVVSDRLARRAARFFNVPLAELAVVSTDDVPDGPPAKEQERETNTGPGRSNEPEKTTGPKRVAAARRSA